MIGQPSAADLLAAVDAMAAQARPSALFAAKPTTPAAGFLSQIRARKTGEAAGIAPGRPGAATFGDKTKLEKLIAEALGVDEKHPLPGIIGSAGTPGLLRRLSQEPIRFLFF